MAVSADRLTHLSPSDSIVTLGLLELPLLHQRDAGLGTVLLVRSNGPGSAGLSSTDSGCLVR